MIKVAAVQMTSGGEVGANLKRAGEFIRRAAGDGAGLVVLPENFSLMQESRADLLAAAEKFGGGAAQDFLAHSARENKVWLVGGSIPLQSDTDNKVKSACLAFATDGKLAARYDKIHLFDVRVRENEGYRESDFIAPGEVKLCTVNMHDACVGLSICYDLRFPEMFRALSAQGATVFTVPSAFTATTGRVHWEILLRARAVENSCFVIAPAQVGHHSSGRRTHGHSLIIGPWGDVLAARTDGEGVLAADLDLAAQKTLRKNFPALAHRRIV